MQRVQRGRTNEAEGRRGEAVRTATTALTRTMQLTHDDIRQDGDTDTPSAVVTRCGRIDVCTMQRA